MDKDQATRQAFQVLRDGEIYGIKFMLKGEPKSIMVSEPLTMTIAYTHDLEGGVPAEHMVTMHNDDNHIMPILRPIEDILVTIEKGEDKVFPFNELLHILDLDGYKGQYSNVEPVQDIDDNRDGEGRLFIDVETHVPGRDMEVYRVYIPEFQVQNIDTGVFLSTNLQTMIAVKEHLDMWHLDYLMLIPRGLAQNVHELDVKIY